MPSSEKKRQQDREYYLRNREKRISQNSANRKRRNAERKSGGLTLVRSDATETSSMKKVALKSRMPKPSAETTALGDAAGPRPHSPQPEPARDRIVPNSASGSEPALGPSSLRAPETKPETPPPEVNSKASWRSKVLWGAFGIRVTFVAFLVVLQAFLQWEFYKAHDILPAYGIGLALAAEASLLSLTSMTTGKIMGVLRLIVWVLLFGYIVAAQGYHAFDGLRISARRATSETTEEQGVALKQRLQKENESRIRYERAGAWDLVETSRAKIEKLEERIDNLAPPRTFKIADEDIAMLGAVLIVLIRALLPIISSLNMIKLRYEFHTLASCREETVERT